MKREFETLPLETMEEISRAVQDRYESREICARYRISADTLRRIVDRYQLMKRRPKT